MSATSTNRSVQILQVPDCPLVERLKSMVAERMAAAGAVRPVEVMVGDYPSPTLVIDGVDVATGNPVGDQVSCRLGLPSPEQILEALTGGSAA